MSSVYSSEEEPEIEIEEEEKEKEKNAKIKAKEEKQKGKMMLVIQKMISDYNELREEEAKKQLMLTFAEKYNVRIPKKVVNRSKAAYDYFREEKIRTEYKGMKIAESSPLISAEWNKTKDNAAERKKWDDKVVSAGGVIGGVTLKDPYGLFAEVEKKNIMKENPDITKVKLNQMCRKRWRDLEEKDKGEWYAKRAKLCETM